MRRDKSPSIVLDFPDCIRRDYPDVFEPCWAATQDVRKLLPNGNYEALARHSPGLSGFGWDSYITLSAIRMVRVARALRTFVHQGARVLDLGSYFGNFALMARNLGYQVDAMDTYRNYSPALDRERSLLETRGIRVIDTSDGPEDISKYSDSFDAVMCLGVIEHIPHTPRELLGSIRKILKSDGYLILDTPNLAYLYRREALMNGLSVYPPIECQYGTEIPFEGHHREYTRREIRWILEKSGFEVVEDDLFNYSIMGLNSLTGEDVRRYKEMEQDPEKREVIFAVARRRPG